LSVELAARVCPRPCGDLGIVMWAGGGRGPPSSWWNLSNYRSHGRQAHGCGPPDCPHPRTQRQNRPGNAGYLGCSTVAGRCPDHGAGLFCDCKRESSPGPMPDRSRLLSRLLRVPGRRVLCGPYVQPHRHADRRSWPAASPFHPARDRSRWTWPA
jgi:hypothetical protein